MFNSFFGLEKPICISPNINMIGPVSKDETELKKQFIEKDKELFDWLEDALAKNEPVVYISLGSVAIW